jgi:hypothetical protein
MGGMRAASIGRDWSVLPGYSQAQTSARLATQAPNSATDRAMGRHWPQEVCEIVRVMAGLIGRF